MRTSQTKIYNSVGSISLQNKTGVGGGAFITDILDKGLSYTEEIKNLFISMYCVLCNVQSAEVFITCTRL